MKELRKKTSVDLQKNKAVRKIVVPDTSVIVQGIISEELKNNKLRFEKIIIHEAVMAELESQANKGRETGYLGLDEITKIRKLSKKGFEIIFKGNRPSDFEIKFAKTGEIDSLIRVLADKEKATLLTADIVQGKVALAKGISVKVYSVKEEIKSLLINDFFVKNVVLVKLKENCFVKTKIRSGNAWKYKLGKKKLTKEDLEKIIFDLIEYAKREDNSFLETDKKNSVFVRINNMRITITKPPLSNSLEIVASKPLESDFKINKSLNDYLLNSRSVLVTGKMMSGKSGFANKILKKISENEDVVSINHDFYDFTNYKAQQSYELKELIHVRKPSVILFNDLKNFDDFRLLLDLRLSGIKTFGVLHSEDVNCALRKIVNQTSVSNCFELAKTIVHLNKNDLKVLVAKKKGSSLEYYDFFSKKKYLEIQKMHEEVLIN